MLWNCAILIIKLNIPIETSLGTIPIQGSRFGIFWVVWEVRGLVLEDESRFGRFKVQNFQVRSNTKWKIYPFFDIL